MHDTVFPLFVAEFQVYSCVLWQYLGIPSLVLIVVFLWPQKENCIFFKYPTFLFYLVLYKIFWIFMLDTLNLLTSFDSL